MKVPINNVQGQNLTVSAPDFCPHCNKNIAPILCAYATNINNFDSIYTHAQFELSTIFLCPNCEKSIFARYVMIKQAAAPLGSFYYREDTRFIYPYTAPKIEISNKIEEFYPDFYNVYIQAVKAENIGLTDICGMGFRKSVEILVKQYLINQNSSLKDKILAESLSQSINRIENPKIKTLALSAVWLGNDETHIIRKFTNYDINDMKDFISALCHLISLDITFEKATSMINSRKKN